MSTLFSTGTPVRDCQTGLTSDTKPYAIYFREMLKRGGYLALSQFESGFVLIAHSEEEVEKTVTANTEALLAAFA